MRTPIVWTLVLSMTLLPVQSTFAGPETQAAEKQQTRLQNIELSAGGFAKGRLVDDKGVALAKREIQVLTRTASEKKTTDSNGFFTVESKTGGQCAIVVDKNAYACRMWKHGTAPEKSLTSFGIVHSGKPVIRGQFDDCGEGCDDGAGGMFGRLGGISSGQLLGLGLLVGAGVAIAIAVHNDDDAS